MTPAELADCLHMVMVKVFAERGLNSALVPAVPAVTRPRLPEHGDYTTNVAMQVARKAGVPAREVARWVAGALEQVDGVVQAEPAGPGFLNIRLASSALEAVVTAVLAAGEQYGRGEALAGRRVNLEFVSANPTGPIHLGGTRWAAAGDALGRIFAAAGAEVTREYYFNDHGAQIDRFARSLVASALSEPTPDDGYAGSYIAEIAEDIVREHPDALGQPESRRLEVFRSAGVKRMFAQIKESLHEFGTDFDVYFNESSLYASGAVDRAVAMLKESGALYSAEGAWWLRSTDYGDDKDRVVLKSDGSPAYIAGDIAYFRDKRARGFDLCIYLLGADHHGYIGRLKAAAAAFGDSPDSVEVLIGQMVSLVRDGVAVKMSKRAGTVITLEDLVDAIGVDAARYALVRSSVNTGIDIDLELWAGQSNENPVYYVQYAHARLASLARNAAELGIGATITPDYTLLTTDREGELVRTIAEYPRVISTAATLREPHRVARYLEELAGAYHRFYAACRILPEGDERPSALHVARLRLGEATRQVLANGLGLLGVDAPERM